MLDNTESAACFSFISNKKEDIILSGILSRAIMCENLSIVSLVKIAYPSPCQA